MLKFKLTPLHKVRLRDVSYLLNVFLIFSLLIDPTNVFLGIKNIVFCIFVLISIPYEKFRYIEIFLVFISIYFFSFSYALISGSDLDLVIAQGYLKAFLFLMYLFWVNDNHLRMFHFFYRISLLIALIEVLLYSLITMYPFLEVVFWNFFSQRNQVIAITRRQFVGIKFLSVYFRTSAVCVISLSVSLFCWFSTKKVKYFIYTCLLWAGLFCSGTRANILAAVLLLIISFLLYVFYIKKCKFLFTVLILCFSFFCIFFIFKLLGDSDEISINTKTGHYISLMNLFASNPIRFLLIGLGPASFFYSEGSGQMEAVIELTYLDLIRNYGLVFTIVIMLIISLPFFYVVRNKYYDKFMKILLSFGYLSYLFIAGTNPLLVSSTGFMVVCMMFYVAHNNILLEV